MDEEIMKLLHWAGRREPLNPAKRIKEFQMKIQRAKNGDNLEIGGFLIGRKPPYAPADAAYYLLSPVPPSELAGLPKDAPRAYLVLRLTEKSQVTGDVKPGRYVVVKGIIDAYSWGNLRMLYVESIEGRDYSEYWLEYRSAALSKTEVEGLLSRTVYVRYEMEKALIYSLYGTPVVLGLSQSWGEGLDLTVYHYKAESELLALWSALKYFHSALPWEMRLRRERVMEVSDPFLDLDFRLSNPNSTNLRYFVPYSRRGLRILPKWAANEILGKRAVGLLPENKEADPTELLARTSEAPFVLAPWEERPYYEHNRELMELMPNLIATLFLRRAEVSSINAGAIEEFRRKYIRWQEEKRDEYDKKFDALIAPRGLMNPTIRYHLSLRLLGSAVRFEGKMKGSVARDVLFINDAIVNDWMVVLRDRPDVLMRLLKEYERYVPRDVRASRALRIFSDLVSTSSSEETTREEFLKALIDVGFSRDDAMGLIERFIAAGYIYEPFPGKLRLVR
ncbi:hypothetical protein E3E23_04115 [Thermococcus sp. CX2]|nr:hypothetical protein [Thermococcus sp. CX2]